MTARMSAAEIAATNELSRPDDTLDNALQLLFTTQRPVPVAVLAERLGQDEAVLNAALDGFERTGRLRRDTAGMIVAGAGVSVVPSDFELSVGSRTCWAWCAKTGLGVLGALAAGGTLATSAPDNGERLVVEFDGGIPRATGYAVLWPTARYQSGCSSAADELCGTFLLFGSAANAAQWAGRYQLDVETITVAAATERSTSRYTHSLGLPETRESLLGIVTG